MALYLLNMYQPDGPIPPPEVLGPIMEQMGELRDRISAAGGWVFSAGLTPSSSATVVRPDGRGPDAEVLITDGPFAEGKEHLGGITIVDAPDLDVALGWAREEARISGLAVEVRPVSRSER